MSPVIAAILSAALPAVVNLIEKLRGPKTGPQKFQDVFAVAITLIQTLATQGLAPKEINDNDVKALIETLVQTMKNNGQLISPAPVAPAGATQKFVVKGGSLELVAA